MNEPRIIMVDEAKAAAPESEIAGQMDGFKAQLEKAKAQAGAKVEEKPAEEPKK